MVCAVKQDPWQNQMKFYEQNQKQYINVIVVWTNLRLLSRSASAGKIKIMSAGVNAVPHTGQPPLSLGWSGWEAAASDTLVAAVASRAFLDII
jgi:hypothetical protein